jgi:Na+-driven multidrug efflux pump
VLQNIVLPSAITSGVTILLAVPVYYLFTISLPWGLLGAAVASNLAELFSFVAILSWSVVIVKSAPQGNKIAESWQGFTIEAFQVSASSTKSLDWQLPACCM